LIKAEVDGSASLTLTKASSFRRGEIVISPSLAYYGTA